MTILHFGVIDIPYTTNVPVPQRRAVVRSRKGKVTSKHTAAPRGGETTGDVAQILEAKYHVMESFIELRNQQIMEQIEQGLLDSMELTMQGQAPTNAFAGAADVIQELFRKAIDERAFDNVIPGVPTKAAQQGIRHSFKHPYAKRDPRASFFDTGQYSASFRVWAD